MLPINRKEDHQGSNMISVYIHIPFCEKICSYCDFCKLFYNEQLVDKYLCALEKEIQDVYQGEEVNTIYIGGGTPSSLTIKQLKKLFDIIKVFHKSKDFEFTIEGNFESTDFEKLNLYQQNGVNRLSFGIETTNSKLLKLLNRQLDKSRAIDIIHYCQKIGLDNINVDLMYALPGEDLSILKEDLDFISSLDVRHVSTYSLIIEDNTVLKIKGFSTIAEDLDYKMYQFIGNYLKDKGFSHYEISNFAIPGYESRHNLVYWKNLEYYGFGLGASGYIDNKRVSNTRSITKYCNGDRVSSCEEIQYKDKIEYEILLGFRTIYGVSKTKFKKCYGKDIDKCYNYSRLLKDGFILEDIKHIWIPPEKWYISNEIIVKFLEGEV